MSFEGALLFSSLIHQRPKEEEVLPCSRSSCLHVPFCPACSVRLRLASAPF